MKAVKLVKCLRCGHEWPTRLDAGPKNCSLCNSPYWNKPRKNKPAQE